MKQSILIAFLFSVLCSSLLWAFAPHTVLLHWNLPTSSCVSVVNIYRTEVPGSEVVGQKQFSVANAQTVNSFTDGTVLDGHTYEYKAGFYGAACTGGTVIPTDGPLSLPATAVIPPAVIPQTAGTPTGFSATVQ